MGYVTSKLKPCSGIISSTYSRYSCRELSCVITKLNGPVKRQLQNCVLM